MDRSAWSSAALRRPLPGLVIGVLARPGQRAAGLGEVAFGRARRQRRELAEERHHRLGAEVSPRLDARRIIERAERDRDPLARDVAEAERGAALVAETALDLVGALPDAGLAARPRKLPERHRRIGREVVADRLLAHPAVTQIGMQ